MAEPVRGEPETEAPRASRPASLVLTLLFVLAAITVSAGLVVYTAWLHDIENGPFAVLFAVLSAKAALSWLSWNEQDEDHRTASTGQQKQD
ncbi:hypothetical protein GBA65_12740 [Rubrobacter marinus]|uniref:Uncharacterized protein n=1 Tax=Rubrobacter marinus TaxID=2653852 RepID=A0A6G8PYD8_9ACTN|nr:hypothetical protein [Rubrobacter marinus]QIN79239.1 hypothetical protein GBA65_12740 [Rubrobacter marinus]